MKSLEDALMAEEIEKTELTRKLVIGGEAKILPVYKVPLKYLYYNDHNDRIASWISEYREVNNITNFDRTDLEEYNNIIEKFIVKSNETAMDNTKKNIKLIGQQQPGVILRDGRVVDGNRRFTCLRQLSKDNIKFGFFETVILDKCIGNDEKQVKLLELMIQHGEEQRVDYNPIDRLVGVYTDIEEKKLLTVKEYAFITNSTEKEVEKYLEVSKIMVEFLEFIGYPKAYYIARNLELDGPFNEAYLILKKESDRDKIEDIKNVLFTNLVTKPNSDMTRYLRKIKEILKNKKLAKPYLEEQLEYTGDVLEILKQNRESEIDKKTIKETINEVRANPVVEKIQKSNELYKGKSEATLIKNKPLLLLEKVENHIREIDPNILDKMSNQQREDFFDTLDEIVDYLSNLKENYYS